MKKIILLIEDLPEEQSKARDLLLAKGYKVAIAWNLKDAKRLWKKLQNVISGILTDLHFPEGANLNKDTSKNPCGFVPVAWALLHNIPVSICSNIDHHFAQFLQDLVFNLEDLSGKPIPFTMDSKDWEKALENLEMLMELKKEEK